MFYPCDPEDLITSAAQERLKLRGKNADVVHVASEITSLKGQAFPLSHMAELNTRHRLDAVWLCSSAFWQESKHDCPLYAWRVEAVPAPWTSSKNCLFCHCIMKICQFFHEVMLKASLHCPYPQYQHGIFFAMNTRQVYQSCNIITSCYTLCVYVCGGVVLCLSLWSWTLGIASFLELELTNARFSLQTVTSNVTAVCLRQLSYYRDAFWFTHHAKQF